MEIREATDIEDAKQIADIYKSDMGKFGTTHTDQDVKQILKNVSNELTELGENRIVFLGFEDNRPIATAQLILKRVDNDPDLANGKNIANVHHLRVAYDKHGLGLGEAMMEKVENYAKEHGITKITLGVDDWNTKAIGFYKHLGYRRFKETISAKTEEKLIYMYKDFE